MRPFPTSLAVLALALPTAAQGDTTIRHDATTLILPDGKHQLADVVRETAEFLGRNILMDDGDRLGSAAIELQTAVDVDHDGAEEVVSDLLFANGFVLCPLDPDKGLWRVINLAGPRGREVANHAVRRTPEEIMARPTLKQPVTTVVTLQRVNANIAVNALRPFFAQQGPGPGAGVMFGTAGNNDTLLLTGIQSEVARAIEVLRQADMGAQGQPPAPDLKDRIARIEEQLARIEQRLQKLEKRLAADR